MNKSIQSNRWRPMASGLAAGIVCLLSVSATAWGAVYTNYVALAGDDANGGTGWGDAYLTITQAVAQARAAIIVAGAEAAVVNVGAGTFNVAVEVVLDQPIALIGRGGVGAAESEQSIVRQTSLVRLFVLSHAGARLDGLVAENGYLANNGQGGNVNLSEGTVTNCVIRKNRYQLLTSGGMNSSGRQRGGGIYMAGGLVADSLVWGNGIGHYCSGFNYTAYSYGGGVYLAGGTLRRTAVTNNHIRVHVDNYAKAAYGAGVYVDGAGAVVENCLVSGNRGYNTDARAHANYRGAGVYLKAGAVRNCTVVANTQSITDVAGGSSHGAGIHQVGGTLVNTIVWGNEIAHPVDVGAPDYSGAAQDATYSCAPELTAGEGNKTVDPLFTAPLSVDYRLLPTSPCVNAGVNQLDWMATAKDLDGNPRIQCGVVDMGVYEWVPPRGILITVR